MPTDMGIILTTNNSVPILASHGLFLMVIAMTGTQPLIPVPLKFVMAWTIIVMEPLMRVSPLQPTMLMLMETLLVEMEI